MTRKTKNMTGGQCLERQRLCEGVRPKARFQVVLQADGPGDEAQVLRRLRAALKTLWRQYRLKAVNITPYQPEGE